MVDERTVRMIRRSLRAAGAFLQTNFGLLALAEVLAFTPLRVLSLGLAVFVGARLLPFAKGIVTKLAVSFILVTTLVVFLATIAWLVHLKLSSALLLSALAVCLAATQLLLTRSGLPTRGRLQITLHDSIALLVAVAAMLLVFLPVLQDSSGARLARLVTAGGDNTSHLEMVKTDDLNRGLPYGSADRVHNGAYANYPQGWHLNVAFMKWLTEPVIHYARAPRNTLLLFYLEACLWFGLLIFFMVRLSLLVTELLPRRLRNPWALLGVAAVGVLVTLHWLLGLFIHGFQAQIASFTFLLLELFFLLLAAQQPVQKRYPLFLLATAMAVANNFIWLFIAPVTFVLVAVAFGAVVVRERRLPPLKVWIALAVLAGFAVVQPLLYKLYPAGIQIPLLLQLGDVQHTSMMTLGCLAVVAGIYTVVRWENRLLRWVSIAGGMALLFSLYLFIYQLNTIHELRYFYFKSTYMFIMLVAIVLAALVYEGLAWLLSQKNTAGKGQLPRTLRNALVITGTLALGVALGWQTRTPYVGEYVQSTVSGISGAQAGPLIDAVGAAPDSGYYVAFLGSCDRGDDIRASQLADSLAFAPAPSLPHGVSFAPGEADENVQFKSIRTFAEHTDHPVTVISSDQVLEHKLEAYMGNEAGKLKIVSMDATPETEPISQCPNRTRDIKAFPVQ